MTRVAVIIVFCITFLIGAFFVSRNHSPEAAREGDSATASAQRPSDVQLASYVQRNGAYGTKRKRDTTSQAHFAAADQPAERSGISRRGASSEVQVAAQDGKTSSIAQNKPSEERPVSPAKTSMTHEAIISVAQAQPASPAEQQDKELNSYDRKPGAKEAIRTIDRSSNISGLTGLMLISSAFTLPARESAVGVSIFFEKSDNPAYTVLQFPVTATYGVTDSVEVGVKTKAIKSEATAASTSQSGIGDSEIAVKWRLDTHDIIFPELAVGLAGILPTGNDSKGLNDVKNWGMKLLAMASLETKLTEFTFLGLYLETQAIFLDQGNKAAQDKYGVINAGLQLPISKDNRLQGILEYNKTIYKRDNPALLEVNQWGVTPGLRYVTKKMNFTAGAQFLSKSSNAYESSTRWICTYGYKF